MPHFLPCGFKEDPWRGVRRRESYGILAKVKHKELDTETQIEARRRLRRRQRGGKRRRKAAGQPSTALQRAVFHLSSSHWSPLASPWPTPPAAVLRTIGDPRQQLAYTASSQSHYRALVQRRPASVADLTLPACCRGSDGLGATLATLLQLETSSSKTL